ncbi:MAG: AAA family ATPase, partial [Deltaproteobacteria bacterium]|nr:AAA family ATPase [Deltaproteobacteria bacterium]
MSFIRKNQGELKEKIEKNQSFILFGPRQTGKSTLLEGIFAQLPKNNQLRYYFQLPHQRSKIEEDPEVILREVDAKSEGKPVYLLIDEIQKIPKITDLLQFLIDKKKIVLAACGSSARKLKTMGTNWLPGRIHLEHLYPLTWEECGLLNRKKSLEEILLFGSLPGILSKSLLEDREKDLASYSHLYLEEEIRMEAVVRNLPRFTKFLTLAALESGTFPNHSKIGSQVGVSHTTIREYFQILEDTLIIHRLNAFGTSRDDTLRAPKYYFFDLGVRNAAAGIGHHQGLLPLQMGILFEHFVILEMIANFQPQVKFSHWRTKKGEEVDLIIEKGSKKIAVEIKATKKPQKEDLKGLEAFSKKYHCKNTLLVCQIEQPQKFDSHLALPWQELSSH